MTKFCVGTECRRYTDGFCEHPTEQLWRNVAVMTTCPLKKPPPCDGCKNQERGWCRVMPDRTGYNTKFVVACDGKHPTPWPVEKEWTLGEMPEARKKV